MADIYLPNNTVCNSIGHNIAYNANYDIVWSFDYSLSGTNGSQGSFTTFLFDGGVSLTGGGPGAGGGFYKAGNYLSGGNPVDVQSLSGAILGINFDTTGLFATSGSAASGLLVPIPNSLSIRYGQTNFEYLTSVSLTSLYTDFKFLLSSQEFNRLRFRLTDVGQTLKVDYSNTNSFVEIASIPINLSINNNTAYKIGISYTSPISGSNAKPAIFSIKNFHVEGKTDIPEINTIETIDNSFAVYPVCALPTVDPPIDPITLRSLTRIPEVPCPVTVISDDVINPCLANFIDLSGSETLGISGIIFTGSYFYTVSAEPAPPPAVDPRPTIQACGLSISDTISFDGNNRNIVDFPAIYTATIGPATGRVGFEYTVTDQSVKFEVYYSNQKVLDTGYIYINDDTTYNLRSELGLRNLTTGAVTALSSNTVFFNKTTTTPTTAEIRVYGPVDGANYTFSLLCPQPVPITYPCGSLITGINYTSPLSSDYTYYTYFINVGPNTGTVTIFYSAFNLPERFQVIYDNALVLDTQWVGALTEQNLNWLNSYLIRVGQSPVETIYRGASAVSISKNTSTTTMEIRVYAPLYNSRWTLSASCPGTYYYAAYIPSYTIDDEIVVSFP